MPLTRKRHAMPDDIREALVKRNLLTVYAARPTYQRNDYLGWITRAKRKETRQRRLEQMLAELAQGDVYMKMPWRARRG